MLNYDMAMQATETSMNSFNSATREQLKYNESLEARLNRLSNATYGLAKSVGESVLYDTIVVITEGLNQLTNAGESTSDSIGVLAPLFAVIGVAAVGLSSNLRMLITTTYAKITSFMAASATNKLYAVSFIGIGTAARLATVALRGLMMATGVGLAFAALGFAIEKVTSAMSSMIQEQEKIDQFNKQNIDALTINKESTEGLIDSYLKLREARESGSGWNSDKEQEYLKVQQTLSDVFPALIDKIDSTGQAHIKNKEAVIKEKEATEELIKAQSRLNLANATEEFKKFRDEISGGAFGSFKNFIYGDLESQIKNVQSVMKELNEKGLDTSEQEVELINLQRQYQTASEQIKSQIFSMMDSIAILDDVEIDDNISSQLQNFISSLDLSGKTEKELTSFGEEIGKLQSDLQQAFASGNSKTFDETIGKINELGNESKDFQIKIDGLTLSYEDLTKTIEKGNGFIDTSMDELGGAALSADAFDEKIKNLTESISELKTVQEQLVGVSESHTTSSEEALFLYEQLTSRMKGYNDEQIRELMNKPKLTAEEKLIAQAYQQREQAIQELTVLYPQFAKRQEDQISLTFEQIEAMKREEKSNKVLLEAYKLSSEGKLTAEQDMTVATAMGAKNRIELIKGEIKALQFYTDVHKQLTEKMKNDQLSISEQLGLIRSGTLSVNDPNGSIVQEKLKELDALQSNLDSLTSTIDTNNQSINDSEKSSKKSNATTKESIYITDEYKNSLEAINLEIQKQQQLQSKNAKHSEAYRKSIKEELRLEKEKLNLIKSQTTAINKQISSGKVVKTGLVDVSSSSSTSTTSKPNGWNGRITSGFGMRMHPTLGYNKMHEGIDIAGTKGTRLDSNVTGKVIRQSYNDISGNFVEIEDSNGFKHFYAHLEKAFVKLGDAVNVGTQIGNIGSTGRSTGAHLHYGVKNASGKYIDPSSFVNSAKNAKGVTSSSSSNEKSASTIAAENAQAIDQAKSEMISLSNDALATQEKIDTLNESLVQSNLDYYDHLVSGIDRSIEMSNNLSSQQLEHSQAYRDELEKENKHQEYKQQILHKQANFIREQLKNPELNDDFKSELSSQLSELTLAWWDVEESIESVNEQLENSRIAEFDREIDKLNDSIAKSNKLMDLYVKGTKEYNAEQKKVITTLHDKQKAYETEAASLRNLMATEKLSVQARERNVDRLKELSTSWLDIQSEIVNINASIADDLISTMKESYEQQKEYDLALKEQELESAEESHDAKLDALKSESKAYEDSMDEQMKALDKAHKDKMEKIEAETKAFEDAINRQLELMRDQKDEESFNKDISGMRKEESSLVNQISELSMDDSREARLQRKKLEEDLAKIRDDIAEKQSDRQFELREKNLQDELDTFNAQIEAKEKLENDNYDLAKEALDNQLELYKREFDAKRKLEEDKYDATRTQLEKERRQIEIHYDNLINNEAVYANLRADIINGNVDGMSEKLKGFLEDFKTKNKDVITELGLSWTELENKINRIAQAQGSISNVTTPSPIKDLTVSNSPISSSGRDSAWQQYLGNKQAWEGASKTEKARLNDENDKLRNTWGFKDGSYSELSKLQKYHDGGIVGGKGNRLTELANKLLNNKPNEQTVVALKRELFSPESNIPNLFANIKAAIPTFQQQSQQGGIIQIENLVNIDNISQNANLDIDKMINTGLDRLVDRMKPFGFKLR